MRPVAALVLTLAALHPVLQAQKPAPSGADRADADRAAADDRLVHIDVHAVDARGRAVVNLRPADFSLLENGVSQKIESAVLTSKTADAAGAQTEVLSPADEERAAKEPGTRVIALYLDEFHTEAGEATDRVRQAATRFLDEQVRPADLVAVMRPLDHLTSIRFSRDRAAVRQVIAGFSGRRDDLTPRTSFEEQYLGKSPESIAAARAQIVMSGVRALASRIGDLEGGLSAIVLVTQGFSPDVPRSRERRLPDLQSLVRVSNRYRIALYALDPGTTAPAPAEGVVASTSPTALQQIARQTGGDAVPAGGDLHSALARVSRDLDTYYVLTYRSSSATDGRFHDLQVASSRRDVQLRARSGYWAPLPFELRSVRTAPPAPLIPMRALRRSPFIDAWFGSTIAPDGTRRAIFTWTPTSPAAAKPIVRADLVTVTVRTPDGKVLFEGDVAPVQSAAITSARADSAVFEVPAGRLQFDFVILRADGTRLDVGAQDFEVPEIKAGPPVVLPPQLFRAASAREFREISGNANAAPIPTREFRRTDWLLIRVPTADPGGNAVAVSARLINRVGTVLIELSPTIDAPAPALSQFDLPLARFAPGEYALEVAAQSPSGTARQLIRLRITG